MLSRLLFDDRRPRGHFGGDERHVQESEFNLTSGWVFGFCLGLRNIPDPPAGWLTGTVPGFFASIVLLWLLFTGMTSLP
jgi:hypothetical protein